MTLSLFWDVLAGFGLSAAFLLVCLACMWRLRRLAFLIVCFLALTAFAWHAGCWYHQFDCPAMTRVATLAQG